MINFKFVNDINSTSKNTADAQAMVLRENQSFRIIYIPKIIDKNDDWTKSVEGIVIAQRKGLNERWEDLDSISLSNLKKGEWTKFELKFEDLLNINNYSNELLEICKKEKSLSKVMTKQILILDYEDDKKSIKNVIDFLKSSSDNSVFSSIIEDADSFKKVIEFYNTDRTKIIELIKNLSTEKKSDIYDELRIDKYSPKVIFENLDKDLNEQFWQDLFKNNPQYLSIVLPSMLNIITDQGYVGGKKLDNTGSSIVDFVYEHGINNISLIEIKTPKTKIIDSIYRGNVYKPSQDLTASIIQVKEQKDEFLKSYKTIRSDNLDKENELIYAYEPRCLLIIGNTKELDKNQIKSFNLFRNELRNIEIITFDELAQKLKIVYEMLGGASDE